MKTEDYFNEVLGLLDIAPEKANFDYDFESTGESIVIAGENKLVFSEGSREFVDSNKFEIRNSGSDEYSSGVLSHIDTLVSHQDICKITQAPVTDKTAVKNNETNSAAYRSNSVKNLEDIRNEWDELRNKFDFVHMRMNSSPESKDNLVENEKTLIKDNQSINPPTNPSSISIQSIDHFSSCSPHSGPIFAVNLDNQVVTNIPENDKNNEKTGPHIREDNEKTGPHIRENNTLDIDDNFVDTIKRAMEYGKADEKVKLSEAEQKAFKENRKKTADEIEIEWIITTEKDFKESLGRKWKNNIDNFNRLLVYVEDYYKDSINNDKAVSLSIYHLHLKEIFADTMVSSEDYKDGGRLEKRVFNVLKVAEKSNLIACVDESYSKPGTKVFYSKLYKINPNLVEIVKKLGSPVPNKDQRILNYFKNIIDRNQLIDSSSSIYSTIQSTTTLSPHSGPIFALYENKCETSLFSSYKIEKFSKSFELEHTPEFIEKIVEAKYSPLIVYPEYEGDNDFDQYHRRFKVRLDKNGKVKKISCREWSDFMLTTKEQAEDRPYRAGVCEKYFGDSYSCWDINGSIYRMTAAINGKSVDFEKDIYAQMWPLDQSYFTKSVRKAFKAVCMTAYMTKRPQDFLKSFKKFSNESYLPKGIKDFCLNVWRKMRDVIGDSHRTEAMFIAGCYERILKFALQKKYGTILQCFDSFYGKGDIETEAEKLYREIISNEKAIEVVRAVMAGNIPKTTLQDIFREII